MVEAANQLATKLNDHTLIGDKNLLISFRFGVITWAAISRARLEKVNMPEMNHPTLRIEYLRDFKDSEFYDSVPVEI